MGDDASLIWNPTAETMPADERARLHLERLRDTVGWAVYRVALYRERVTDTKKAVRVVERA